MNKGEQAMAVAKTLLAANKTQQAAGKRAGVSQPRIAQANTVLKYTPDLARERKKIARLMRKQKTSEARRHNR